MLLHNFHQDKIFQNHDCDTVDDQFFSFTLCVVLVEAVVYVTNR